MSSRKFKFVSPGVFLREVDNSQIPAAAPGVGPLIIGRTRRGPAMKPVTVQSYEEYVRVFGESIPGGERDDVWRDGNGLLATSYAPYAAEAYFKAGGEAVGSPVTVMRLLGVADAAATDAGHPGWAGYDPYGIFMTHRDVNSNNAVTASLVGVVYGASSTGVLKVGFSGRDLHTATGSVTVAQAVGAAQQGARGSQTVFVRSADNNGVFTMSISSSAGLQTKDISFESGDESWIRKQWNTNPVITNNSISTATGIDGSYWLGETFEEKYQELVRKHGKDALAITAMKLNSNMADFQSANHQLEPAKTGWVFPQHVGDKSEFDATTAERLFRLVSLQEGEQGNRYIVKIENIRISENDLDPYGKFDIVVQRIGPNGPEDVESWPNCNLNPSSERFVANQIGDQYFVYNSSEKRNRVYGSYPNNSSYIRVEMANEVGENGPTRKSSVPFGYLGPILPKDATGTLSGGKVAISDWVADTVTYGSSSAAPIRFEWPTPQVPTTASIPAGANSKAYFGVTTFKLQDSTAGVVERTGIPDPGYHEYLRAMSVHSSYLADQKNGLTTNATKYGYTFSLDDVVLNPAPGNSLNGDSLDGVNY